MRRGQAFTGCWPSALSGKHGILSLFSLYKWFMFSFFVCCIVSTWAMFRHFEIITFITAQRQPYFKTTPYIRHICAFCSRVNRWANGLYLPSVISPHARRHISLASHFWITQHRLQKHPLLCRVAIKERGNTFCVEICLPITRSFVSTRCEQPEGSIGNPIWRIHMIAIMERRFVVFSQNVST